MRAPRVLFICGSHNQTTQMHQIAAALPDVEAVFSPFAFTGTAAVAHRLRLLDHTVGGPRAVARCLRYLKSHHLQIDTAGRRGGYDLVLLPSDVYVADILRGTPRVLVQEGILDPPNPLLHLIRRSRHVPRWLAGTASTGQSHAYERFCVASHGYYDHFVRLGLDPGRLVITGIPNFDDCARYRENDFPHRNHVLVCTSDARETFKRDDRRGFIRRAVDIAAGRLLLFKLHPNEWMRRAVAEIRRHAPGALVYAEGKAEEMVANADVVICQYSTLAFVALALGKEVHSYFGLDELRRLLPEQNGSAAGNIADVCREVLDLPARQAAR